MIHHPRRPHLPHSPARLRRTLPLLLTLAAASSASAATMYWTGAQYTPGPGYPAPWPTAGSWFDPDNWQGYTLPTAADTALFGSAPILPNGNTTHSPHTIHFGNFGYYADTVIPGGPATVGTLYFSSDAWTFDFASGQNPDFTGTLTPSMGALTVTSLTLSPATGRSASLTLPNGTLSTQTLEVAPQAGTATFTQSGRTHRISNYLVVASPTGDASVYHLSDGSLSTYNEYIGHVGMGRFRQTGGTQTIYGSLILAGTDIVLSAGGVGSFELSNGQLTVSQEILGITGVGTFTQSGGSHTIGIRLDIGCYSGTGTYALSGGQFTANLEDVGYSGIGSFTQTGGTHTVANFIQLGVLSNALGRYDLSNTGILAVPNLVLGGSNVSGGTGVFSICGGTATISSTLKLWNSAGTSLTLSGGTLAVGTLDISLNPAAFSWTGGVLLLTGPTSAALTVPTAGTLGGSGTLTGNLTNNGTLAPGNSPGVLTINGNYTQSATATLLLEIAGTAPTSYDRLKLTGTSSLTLSGTVALAFLPGYTPAPGDTFDFLDWTGTLTSNGYTFDFSRAPLPSNFAWDTAAFNTTGQISIVPEPASLALLTLASATLLTRRRPKSPQP